MKIQPWRIAAASAMLLLAACGGGGGGSSSGADVTVPEFTGQSQETGMVPNPNGFAFPNFGSAGSPEVFNEADLVEMFGATAEVCEGGVASPCTPTAEAAAFARLVNDSRAAGHCEGFAVLAAARFTQAVKPNSVELLNQGDVTHGIMRAFATQFLKETQDETDGWAKKSLQDKLAALEASFKSKTVGYSLGVYTDDGGHAVLPYAIKYETPELAKIMVYDSNFPGQERFVKVDLAAKQWEFSFGGADPNNDPNAWSGGSKDLDITSMATREAGTCPFCGDKSGVQKSLLVIRSALPDWKIETADGVLTPGSSDVGASTVRPVRSSTPGATNAPVDYIVTTPSGQDITLNLPSQTRVNGITPNAVIQVESQGSNEGSVVVNDTSIKSTDTAAVVTVADGNFVGSTNGAPASITTAGTEIAIVTESASGQPVAEVVNQETPAVEVVVTETNYEVRSETSGTTFERRTVDSSGKETVVNEDGQLSNTQVDKPLPEALVAPEVKPGLSEASERAIGGTSPTTTVEGATTTTAASTTTVAGTPTTVRRTTPSTLKPTATTVPQATASTVSRSSVRVDVNVDNWSLAASDPASSGFSAVLSGSSGAIQDGINCDSVGCLEGAATDVLSSGGGSTTSLQFKMSGVSSAFDVRCGNAGGWVAASQSGGAYSATCSFSDVSTDETVYVRA
jgi:hypothetical protein